MATQPRHLRKAPHHMANVLTDEARRMIFELFKHSEVKMDVIVLLLISLLIHPGSSSACFTAC